LVKRVEPISSNVEERRLAHTHKNLSTLAGYDQVGDVKREKDIELVLRILSVDEDAHISGDGRKVQENPVALPVERNPHGAAQPSHLHRFPSCRIAWKGAEIPSLPTPVRKLFTFQGEGTLTGTVSTPRAQAKAVREPG
jgi:hypothetical protein